MLKSQEPKCALRRWPAIIWVASFVRHNNSRRFILYIYKYTFIPTYTAVLICVYFFASQVQRFITIINIKYEYQILLHLMFHRSSSRCRVVRRARGWGVKRFCEPHRQQKRNRQLRNSQWNELSVKYVSWDRSPQSCFHVCTHRTWNAGSDSSATSLIVICGLN